MKTRLGERNALVSDTGLYRGKVNSRVLDRARNDVYQLSLVDQWPCSCSNRCPTHGLNSDTASRHLSTDKQRMLVSEFG